MIDPNRLCPGCMKPATGDRICKICGYDSVSKNDPSFLNVRFLLARKYVIGKVLERSSESVTYLAFDSEANEAVNIKEYFPLDIAVRNPDRSIAVHQNQSFAFNNGLLEFISLNRKLINLESASIVPVMAVFEDNGTAYAVLANNTGITLSRFLEINGGILKWEQARPLFLPLIDTVITLNENGIILGGISPETVYVGRDGKLRLSNISIIETRFASENFKTAIYPGCAAIEQYSTEKGNIGLFTDVYGLAATIFRVLIGNLPPAANERINNDSMSIPSHFADELPRQVLVSLANALQVKIAARTPSAEKFRDEIVYGETAENLKKAEIKRRNAEVEHSRQISQKIEGSDIPGSEAKKGSSVKYALIAALSTVLIVVAIGTGVYFTFKNKPKDDGKSKTSSASSVSSVSSFEDTDSDSNEPDVKLYTVPNLCGKYYAKIEDDDSLTDFIEAVEIEITDKKFSNTIPKGAICEQSIAADKEVQRGTKLTVVISLGPQKIKMVNVSDKSLSKDQAILELLKQGFLYENIEVLERFMPDKQPDTVVDQTPASGQLVSSDSAVKIYINPQTDENEGNFDNSDTGEGEE